MFLVVCCVPVFSGSPCPSVCLSCDLCLCCFGVGLGGVCVCGLHSCLNWPKSRQSSLQTVRTHEYGYGSKYFVLWNKYHILQRARNTKLTVCIHNFVDVSGIWSQLCSVISLQILQLLSKHPCAIQT